MNDNRLKQLINEELSKADISNLIKDENSKLLKSKDFELRIKQISGKVIEELYRILWQRKNFWSDTINK